MPVGGVLHFSTVENHLFLSDFVIEKLLFVRCVFTWPEELPLSKGFPT